MNQVTDIQQDTVPVEYVHRAHVYTWIVNNDNYEKTSPYHLEVTRENVTDNFKTTLSLNDTGTIATGSVFHYDTDVDYYIGLFASSVVSSTNALIAFLETNKTKHSVSKQDVVTFSEPFELAHTNLTTSVTEVGTVVDTYKAVMLMVDQNDNTSKHVLVSDPVTVNGFGLSALQMDYTPLGNASATVQVTAVRTPHTTYDTQYYVAGFTYPIASENIDTVLLNSNTYRQPSTSNNATNLLYVNDVDEVVDAYRVNHMYVYGWGEIGNSSNDTIERSPYVRDEALVTAPDPKRDSERQ